jgi:hypothetical protein
VKYSLLINVERPSSIGSFARGVMSPFSRTSAREKFWDDVEHIRKRVSYRSSAGEKPRTPSEVEQWLQSGFPKELLEDVKVHYRAEGARLGKEKEFERTLDELQVTFVAFHYGSLFEILNFSGIENLASALGFSFKDFVHGFAEVLSSYAPQIMATGLGIPPNFLSASANTMNPNSSSSSQSSDVSWRRQWWVANTSLVFPVALVMAAAYVAFAIIQDQFKSMAEERKTFITGVQTQVTALSTERTDARAKILANKLAEAKLALESQKQTAAQQARLFDAQLQYIKDANAGTKARETAEANLYKTILDRSKPPSPPATPPPGPAEPTCAGIGDGLLAMKIQLALKERGLYLGAIDGYIGRGSRASLTAFQRSQGWEERGLRDKDTLAKLKIGC